LSIGYNGCIKLKGEFMLNILHEVEALMPALLKDERKWQSLFVNYHPPTVERLWREWNGYRVSLHRIYPCVTEEALFHPHPWPSAMRMVSGTYEMAIGFSSGEEPPPFASRLILGAGSEYEMTHPDGWHYVRPIGEPTLSVMVTGKPWNRPSPKSDRILQHLSDSQITELFRLFRNHYR
jgi:hypothetical protein